MEYTWLNILFHDTIESFDKQRNLQFFNTQQNVLQHEITAPVSTIKF